MYLDLQGKVFVVTGAAQGIGAAIVQALLEERATVAAIDLDAKGLARFADTPGVKSYAADLGAADSAQNVCEQVLGDFAQVYGLVTAAGGVRGQVGKVLEAVSPDEWHAIFAANVDAAMWCAKALAPGMKLAGSGRIVTISSGAGLRPSLTGIQAYAAAKHALVGLTRQLAQELGSAGITVNSVAPGFVLSNPSTQAQWEAFGEHGQQDVLNAIYTRRLGSGEDIANAVLFFCSTRASWVTGQILQVDGGHS